MNICQKRSIYYASFVISPFKFIAKVELQFAKTVGYKMFPSHLQRCYIFISCDSNFNNTVMQTYTFIFTTMLQIFLCIKYLIFTLVKSNHSKVFAPSSFVCVEIISSIFPANILSSCLGLNWQFNSFIPKNCFQFVFN